MSVPAIITERWRSQQLVQEAQHVLVVRVRPGFMDRGYLDANRLDTQGVVPIFPPLIWKGINHSCWKGQWTPTGDWVILPQIQSADFTTSFQSVGSGTGGSSSGQTSSVLTAVMDNIQFEPVIGVSGLYHTIKRGYFSPLRGTKVNSRPSLWPRSEWTDALNGGYQIELWEGYGDAADSTCIPLLHPEELVVDGVTTMTCAPTDAAIKRTWTGIIETCNITSSPDIITMTARDFGLMFTDQRCMGWNKAREIRAPVHFNDRKQAQGQIEIQGPLNVDSGLAIPGHGWQSGPYDDPTNVAWIEMTLPAGYYEDFFWAPEFDDQQMYVSLKMGPGGGFKRTGTHFDEGWVDLGLGSVPGGGPPWIRHWHDVIKYARRWALDNDETSGYNVPDGTVLRLSFTDLTIPEGFPDGHWFAGGNGFNAYKFGTDPSVDPGLLVNATHWILVEDASDVVRMVLIWCGFQEWNVESFGWTLAHEKIYNENSFFMDIINDSLAEGNFMFWMGPPTNDDRSIGVPNFQHQTATDPTPAGILTVRDSDLLEDAEPVWDNSDLPYVMRYRGKISKTGQTLDQDLVKRYEATYYPPWTGDAYSPVSKKRHSVRPNRVAGIRRHFTQTLGATSTVGLESDEECLFACLLAAIQYAVQMYTCTIQISGYPGLDLQKHIQVIDQGSGVNGRLWIASLESHHKMGPQGSWHMTVGGSLIDSTDMFLIRRDYAAAWGKQQSKKLQEGESIDQGFSPVDPGGDDPDL